MHALILLACDGVRCVFSFCKILYNFIKGAVRMYTVLFKKLRPFFLYLTYELVQILLSLTELMYFWLSKLTNKYRHRTVVIVLYTPNKAMIK